MKYVLYDYNITDKPELEIKTSNSLGGLYDQVDEILIAKIKRGNGVVIQHHTDLNAALNKGVPHVKRFVSMWEISYPHLDYHRFLIVCD